MFVNSVQALKINGVSVGGVASVGSDGSYTNTPTDAADGAVGGDVDRSRLQGTFRIDCNDVTKVNAILAAASADTTFSGRVAGGTNYQHGTLVGTVIGGMTLNFPAGADATLNLSGAIRFPTDAATMADVELFVVNGTPPGLVYPPRLHRPNGASFNAGTPIAPKNLVSIALSMQAEMDQEGGDAAVGMTAVERGPWSPLKVTMVFKDKTIDGGSDICTQLVRAERGVLTSGLLGRAGGADRTLTVKNVLWTGSSRVQGRTFWQFTLNGQAGWHDATTAYTLNAADKLFEIA